MSRCLIRSAKAAAAGRPQARSDTRRASLVEAGIAAFGAQGFEGASLRDIARRSGAGLAAVSYHFGGKRELYLACAEEIARHLRAMTDRIVTALDDPAQPDAARRVAASLQVAAALVLEEKPRLDWPRFFLRCEAEDAEAFGLIFDGALVQVIARLAETLDETPLRAMGAEELRFRIGALMIMCFSLRSHPAFGFAALGRDPREEGGAARLALRLQRLYLPELDAPG